MHMTFVAHALSYLHCWQPWKPNPQQGVHGANHHWADTYRAVLLRIAVVAGLQIHLRVYFFLNFVSCCLVICSLLILIVTIVGFLYSDELSLNL
jgi:hypothetical protein